MRLQHVMEKRSMTISQAQAECGKAGCTLRKTAYGEYRVNYKGGMEATAYYTTDLDDAVSTARAMAREVN